jgi:MFS family permease
MFLCAFSFGVILTIIPDYSDSMEMEKWYFFAVFTTASLLVRVVAGKISDRYGREAVLRYSTLAVTVSMIFVGAAQSPISLLVASAFLGFSAGMNSPTIFAWTIDLSHPNHRARAMATMFIAMELGIGLGALAAGFMVDNQIDRIPYPFYLGAIMSGAAFVYIEFVHVKGEPNKSST